MKQLSQIRGDVLGGLTAGIVALPLALAFGVASGAGATAGLYGAIALGFFAAIFGGTPTQISGPTGPMTVIFAAALLAFPHNPTALFASVFLAGILQIALGWFKVGTLVQFMPYPVISGFMSGIGVIIILLQLHPLLGAASVSSPIAAVLQLPQALTHVNTASLLLGGLTMAIVFLVPIRVSRVVPSPLIALFVGTILAATMHLDVATIGAIPRELPQLVVPLPPLLLFPKVASMAIALAILGTIDSLLTSVVADSMTKTRHNPNRELIGQGIGNMAAALVGGLPGAGATMRTVVNIKAGGTGRLSGVVHALLLLAILLGLGPLAAQIPLAVLAGILIKVGVDILDYRLLRMIRRIPRTDLTVMTAVFLITVFVDLIVAVGVGVTLASLMVTWRIAKHAQVTETAPENIWQQDLEREVESESNYGVRIINVSGAFFFGTTAKMQEHVSRMMGAKVVIINCSEVPFLDLSGFYALSEMIDRLKNDGIKPLVVVHEGLGIEEQMEKMGYRNLLGRDGLHTDSHTALQLAWEYLHPGEEEPVAGNTAG